MRFLLGAILLGAAAWAGYWFVGAGTARAAFEGWFEARRAEGWQAEYENLDIAGFPNRFDAGFSDIALADPGTGLAWEAPFFQILALSYRPNHVIAVWPDEQLVATPLAKYTVQSSDMRASAVLDAGTTLRLDRATLTAEGLVVTPEGAGAPLQAEALTLAAEHVPADPASSYRLGLVAEELHPPTGWQRQVDPGNTLPDSLSVLRADLRITFDKPWDRFAIEEARPQPQLIRLKLAEASWGQLSLQAAGEVRVDAAGQPSGTITIKARNWREILELARNSGRLGDGMADTIEEGLGMVARMSGNPGTLDIPLEFADGRIWLGPVPLAPAPVLRLR